MTKNETNSTQKLFYWAAVVMTVLAIGVHTYLSSTHYGLKYGGGGKHTICNISESFNCEAVSASRYAEFLGVPMAVWGALTNLLFLALLLLHPMRDESRLNGSRRNLLLFASGIAGASIVMGGISLIFLNTFCLFCIIAYALSFLGLIATWKGVRGGPSNAPLTSPGFSFGDIKELLIAGIVILIGGFITNDSVNGSYGVRELNKYVPAQLAEWQSNPVVAIQTIEPLTLGASKENAKMTIVEFADFRCGHCKQAASTLHAFVSANPKDVRFEFQTWPLDGECNTSIKQSNGASCLLARVAFCASQQNKGWQAHDFLFENQHLMSSVDAVKGQVSQLCQKEGIDCAALEACTNSDKMKSLIERQAALGTSLKVQGTPAIFVNGRLLPNAQFLPILKGAYDAVK